MKKQLSFLLVLCIFLNLFLQEKLITRAAEVSSNDFQFKLTENTYKETDNLKAACEKEYGKGAVIADWNDIKALYGSNIASFLDKIGLQSGEEAFVTSNGSEFNSGTRHYFISRHNGSKPGSYLAHDNISSYYLSLGSWYGVKLKILVKLPANSQNNNDSEEQSEIGKYVKFGRYNEEDILWRVIQIDENGYLLFSDKILTLKAFDAKGDLSENRGIGYRKTYGSNFWETSNIREWLNSRDSSVSYSHQPPDETHVSSGNAYDDEPGFLNSFSSDELALVNNVSHKMILSGADRVLSSGGSELYKYSPSIMGVGSNYENSYYKNVSDTVFLLDDIEIKDYVYMRNFETAAKPTSAAVTNSEYKSSSLSADKYWPYWLRTPCTDSEDRESLLNPDGTISSNYGDGACSGRYGVRPALYLKALSAKGGSGTDVDPYILSLSESTSQSTSEITPPSLIDFSGVHEVEQGKVFALPGKIVSKDKITKVTAGVLGWKDSVASAVPNSNVYNLSNLKIDTSTWGIPITGQFTVTLWAKTESYTDPKEELGTISLVVYPKWSGFYAPESLVASAADSSSARLSWNAVEGASSYKVYYSEGDESNYKFLGTAVTANYYANNLKPSVYCFKVKSVFDKGESDYSNSARAITGGTSSNYPFMYRALVYRFPGEDLKQKFAGFIDAAAKKYDVDPNLICSIINKESGFNPKAESKAGARGMMQMMPGQGKKYGLNTREDFFNAEKNIEAGTHYIRDLLYNTWTEAALDKRVKLTLASFNAGTPQVNQWIVGAKNSGYCDWWYRDWDKFKGYSGVASETRDYVDPIYNSWINTFVSALPVAYISSPMNGTISSIGDLNFTWKPVSGVSGYKVSMANITWLQDFGADGIKVLDTEVSSSVNSFLINKSSLTPGTRYRLGVCPLLRDGSEGEWSVTSFYIPTDKPVFKTKNDYEMVSGVNSKIEWNSVEGAVEYRVSLADITNPSDECKDSAPKILELTSNSVRTMFDVQGYQLGDGRKYRIYVEAVDANGLIQWQTCSFTFKQKNKPSIISGSPSSGETKVELNSNIEIYFDKAVSQGAGFNKISLSDDRGNKTLADIKLNQNALVIKPSKLNNSSRYILSIPGNAVKDNYGNSMEKEYSLSFSTVSDYTAPKLSVSPAGNTYASSQTVKITASEDSTVYYTTNGTEPTALSTRYNGSILISKTSILKYFAVDKNNNKSQVYTESYNIVPKSSSSLTVSASIKQGYYKTAQTIVLKASGNSVIYYTTDGTEPSIKSAKYSGPIKISTSCLLRYFAVDAKGVKSLVYSEKYTIDNEKPQITMTGVQDGMLVEPGVLQISANVKDMSNLKELTIAIDGLEVAKNYAKNAVYNWNTTQGTAGEHTITVKARDDIGNETLKTIKVTALPINQSPYKNGSKKTDSNWDVSYNPSSRVLTASVDAQLKSKVPLAYHICIVDSDTYKVLYEGDDELSRIYPTEYERYYSRSWSIDEFPGVREGGNFKIGIKIYGLAKQISADNYLSVSIPKMMALANAKDYYFDQNMYSNVKYSVKAKSENTIASSGCGPTSMAMVVKALTSKDVNPVDMASYAMNNGFRSAALEDANGGTAWGFFGSASSYYGIKCKQTDSTQEVINALSDGKHIVIASMGANSHFTKYGHYIVLQGHLRIDDKDYFSVLDPNGSNKGNYYKFKDKEVVETGSKGMVYGSVDCVSSERLGYWIFNN